MYRKKWLRRRVKFSDLVQGRMQSIGLSMRQTALRAQLSPSYLLRILSGERGLPSDDSLLKLAQALEIDPPEELLIAAGRLPEDRPEMIPLFRVAAQLTTNQIEELTEVAERIAKKTKRERK